MVPRNSLESDTWYLPRVCGTFKERAGWHGCQMPEQLLGRIIRGCSNPGATVLDPFGGSGTTLTVAKKLGRRFLGFELSPDYASAIEARLASAKVGQSLEGGVEPLAGGRDEHDPAIVRTDVRRPSIFQALFGWFRSQVFTGRMISVGTPSASPSSRIRG